MFIFDKYGILGQIQYDGNVEGGDSVCWMGHYLYLTKKKFPFSNTFERSFGAYVRHPDPKQTYYGFGAYYKNPWDGVISRDQLTGVIAGLISQQDRLALLRVMCHHALSLFLFSYNTRINGQPPTASKWKMPDLTFFNIWALYLRGFGKLSWVFYPLLVVLDLHLLIDTLISNRSSDEDQINFTIRTLIAKDNVPTIISKLAYKILNKEFLLSNLKAYWCGWRQQPGMYNLYKERLK